MAASARNAGGDDRARHQRGGTKAEVRGDVWLHPRQLAAAGRTMKAAAATAATGEGRDVGQCNCCSLCVTLFGRWTVNFSPYTINLL